MANLRPLNRWEGESVLQSLLSPAHTPASPVCEKEMLGVRFLDPRTNEIMYPDPFCAGDDPIISHSETSAPPAGSPTLHPMLAPAQLQWDTRRSPQTLASDWRQEDLDRLAEPATSPPAARLELRSPQLPWAISVRPRTPHLYVTVHDVLGAIYGALKTAITQGEWELFEDTRKHWILDGRSCRVKEYNFGRMLDELYRHPRRVDILGVCTQFAGLVPAPHRSTQSFDLELVRRG